MIFIRQYKKTKRKHKKKEKEKEKKKKKKKKIRWVDIVFFVSNLCTKFKILDAVFWGGFPLLIIFE